MNEYRDQYSDSLSQNQLRALDQQSFSEKIGQMKQLFQTLSAIHIVSFIVFAILLIALIILMKRYMIKFASFFILRQDFQRIKEIEPVQQQNANNNISALNEIKQSVDSSSFNTSVNYLRKGNLSNEGSNDSKVQQFRDSLKYRILQNLQLFHSLYAVAFSKVKNTKRLNNQRVIRLPIQISLTVLLASFFISCTLSFALTHSITSICQQKRFFHLQSYACQNQESQNKTDKAQFQIGFAIIISVASILVSALGVHSLSKNYLKFMKTFTQNQCQEEFANENGQEYNQNLKTKMLTTNDLLRQKNPTLIEDSDFSRKSIKGVSLNQGDFCNNNNIINNDLFQINEIDEDQIHSSPLKEISKVLGENKNLNNTLNSSQMKHNFSLNGKQQFDMDPIPPDFNQSAIINQSIINHIEENDENKQNAQQQKSHLSSSRFKRGSTNKKKKTFSSTPSDLTTIIDGGIQLSNNNKNLEGIREEYYEETYTNARLKEAGFLSEHAQDMNNIQDEISREYDTSRINMLSSNRNTQHKQNSFLKTILLLLVSLIIALTFILGLIFDLYSLFNMTQEALSLTLSIFGISIVIDFFILRIILISLLSLTQSMMHNQTKKPFILLKPIQEETLTLLGNFYESYEIQFTIEASSQCFQNDLLMTQMLIEEHDSDSSNRSKSKTDSNKGQQRQNLSIKQQQVIQRKRQIGDLILVESSMIYQAPASQTFSQRPIEIQSNNDEENQINMNTNLNKRKSANSGQRMSISKSMTFNATDIQIHIKKQNQDEIEHKDESNYDIEEIPIHQNDGQDQIHIDDEERSFILPPINQVQQFETPRLEGHKGKGKSKGLIQAGISSQVVTFIDPKSQENNINNRKSVLRDFLGLSGSKQGSPNKNEYQSIKKYLDNDLNDERMRSDLKDFQKEFSKKIAIKSSQHKTSSQIETDENMGSFTPQYNSQNKGAIITRNQKSSLTQKQVIKLPSNKLLDLKELQDDQRTVFSDIKNVNIQKDLQKGEYYDQKSGRQSLSKRAMHFEDEYGSKVSQTSVKKSNYNSPQKLKENIGEKLFQINMMQPNISPFNEDKMNRDPTGRDLTQGNPKPFSNFSPLKENIVSFNQLSNQLPLTSSALVNKNKNLVQNLILQDNPFISMGDMNNQNSKQISGRNSNQQTKTINDTIESNVKDVLNAAKRKGAIRPKKVNTETFQEINTCNPNQRVDSNEFASDDSASKSSNQKTQFKLQKVEMNQNNKTKQQNINSKQSQVQKKSVGSQERKESEYQETNRSRVYEDSDSSTFRMINFNNRKSNGNQSNQPIKQKQSLKLSEYDSKGKAIDFYSNASKNNKVFDLSEAYKFKSKKGSVMHIEESPGGQSNKQNQLEANAFNHGETSRSSNAQQDDEIERNFQSKNQHSYHLHKKSKITEQNEEDFEDQLDKQQIIHQDEEEANASRMDESNILSKMMRNMNKEDLQEAAQEAEDYDLKFCQRKSLASVGHKKNKNRKSSEIPRPRQRVANSQDSNHDLHSQSSYEALHAVNITGKNQKRQAKDEIDYHQRIQEQKRKLKNFLKLAKQLKTIKDEEIILGLLLIIKETKRPLPMAKINELKKLELMASPYNQSLIAMIKDEFDNYKKQSKPPSAQNKVRNSKSYHRGSEIKTENMLKQLNGIYGQNSTQNSFSSGRQQNGGNHSKRNATTREESNTAKPTANIIKNQLVNPKSQARQHQSNNNYHIEPIMPDSGNISLKKRSNKQKPQSNFFQKDGEQLTQNLMINNKTGTFKDLNQVMQAVVVQSSISQLALTNSDEDSNTVNDINNTKEFIDFREGTGTVVMSREQLDLESQQDEFNYIHVDEN